MSKKQKPNQAAMIRSLLAKKVSVEKIVEQVKKACGGKPTPGYIRWIAKHAPKAKAAKPAKKDKPARRVDGTVDEHLA